MDKELKKMEVIIYFMIIKECCSFDVINGLCKKCIVVGFGI